MEPLLAKRGRGKSKKNISLSEKLLSQTNSSMTDLSVLYSKVNDLWLPYTSNIIIVLWSSLWPKHIRTKLPNGFKHLHPIMFSLMASTMYLTSSSLTYGPAGRHIPTLNNASDTPLTYAMLDSDV